MAITKRSKDLTVRYNEQALTDWTMFHLYLLPSTGFLFVLLQFK